jgi:WD40 repeat protein
MVSDLVVTDVHDPDLNGPSARIDAGVTRIAFTPDGTRVLAGTTDGTVAVWDGKSSEAAFTDVAAGAEINRLAVSPDGTRLATGSINLGAEPTDSATIRLWQLDGSRLTEESQIDDAPYGYGLAFTPDGSRLVIGGANQLAIHSLDGGQNIIVDLPDEIVRSVAVSPDGTMAAVGLWSGPVRLIDLDTGDATGDDLRVAARVTDMAFREDGDVLVTVSEDGDFILWDLDSRSRFSDQPLTAVKNVGGERLAPSLGVAPDIAVTASSADGRVLRWSLDPEEWIREGCQVHRRDLSEAEKERFGLTDAAPICSE